MKKRTKAYERYREKFYTEKKQGNVKVGVRVLTPQQYKRARSHYKMADKEILNAQTMLHSKAEKNRVWREYKRIRKTYSRGESYTLTNKYIKGQDPEGDIIFEEEESEMYYHYNLSGLLKDKNAIHMLITARILEGEDRLEVLADYGY